MIFDISTLIETCSRGITLHPRDIIATVTPAGVGVVLKPTAYLQQGDAINVAIEGTGFIDNKFIGRSIFSWRAA